MPGGRIPDAIVGSAPDAVPWFVAASREDSPMRNRSLLSTSTLVVLWLLAAAAPAEADYRGCERAISLGSAKLIRLQYKALRRCNDAVVKGARPGPCPDAPATARIASATSKLRAAIDAGCGGGDGHCGNADDESLAAIGWDIGSCPDLASAACGNTILDCGDVADCVICVDGAAVAQQVGATYGALDVPAGSPSVLGCQRIIGRATEKFASQSVKAMAKCQSRVILGYAHGPCPDPIAVAVIAKAEAKKVKAICKFCGGADRRCGTADDLAPATIGFAATCPDVTVPAGAACAAPIGDLQGVVDCVDCVASFNVDCAAAAAAPAIAPYPAVCGAPAATATATPPAGASATPPVPTSTPSPSPSATPMGATPTLTLPLPSLTLPLPTLTLPLPTLTPPLPSLTLPLPTLTLPLPSVTLPLPSITLPMPSLTLPLPTITIPLLPTATPGGTTTPTLTGTRTPTPTSTPVCGNGIIEPGEQCELLGGGCSGLQLCVFCQCVL